MKEVIFSDLHIPPTVSKDDTIMESAQWVYQMVVDSGAEVVVYLGDLYHNPSKSLLPANLKARYVLDLFKTLAGFGVTVLWLCGNHDLFSDEYNALQLFDAPVPNFHIVNQNSDFLINGVTHVCLPYTIEYDKKRDALDTMYLTEMRTKAPGLAAVFAHLPIEGIALGGSRDHGVAPGDLAIFDVIFEGHYHQPTTFEYEGLGLRSPFWLAGTLCPQDFKDKGFWHGALMWDTDTNEVTPVPNPHRHVYLIGSREEVSAEANAPGIGWTEELVKRSHIRFTEEVGEAEVNEWHDRYANVEVRPRKEARQASDRAPFALEGDPRQDLVRWIDEAGMGAEKEMLLARGGPLLEGRKV